MQLLVKPATHGPTLSANVSRQKNEGRYDGPSLLLLTADSVDGQC